MYVAISMLNHTLDRVAVRPTFEEAVKAAIEIVQSHWLIEVVPSNTIIRESLETDHMFNIFIPINNHTFTIYVKEAE